jgi:hypothetical protein
MATKVFYYFATMEPRIKSEQKRLKVIFGSIVGQGRFEVILVQEWLKKQ